MTERGGLGFIQVEFDMGRAGMGVSHPERQSHRHAVDGQRSGVPGASFSAPSIMAPPSDRLVIRTARSSPPVRKLSSAVHREARLPAPVDFLGRGANGPDQGLFQGFDAGCDLAGQHPDLVGPLAGLAGL